MADDDTSIDRAVEEATSAALRKLQEAARNVEAARGAFDHAVGLASWGTLGDKLARRSGYRSRYDDLVGDLRTAAGAITSAQEDCRALRRIAGR